MTKEEFDNIFASSYYNILYYAGYLLKGKNDEDVQHYVMLVYEHFAKNPDKVRDGLTQKQYERFFGWVAYQRAINYYRSKDNKNQKNIVDNDISELAYMIEDENDIYDESETNEMVNIVINAIDNCELPLEAKHILTLYYYEGFNLKYINENVYDKYVYITLYHRFQNYKKELRKQLKKLTDKKIVI